MITPLEWIAGIAYIILALLTSVLPLLFAYRLPKWVIQHRAERKYAHYVYGSRQKAVRVYCDNHNWIVNVAVVATLLFVSIPILLAYIQYRPL